MPFLFLKLTINGQFIITNDSSYNHFHNILKLCYKFSFHYKWSDAQLLLVNTVYTIASRVAERLKAEELRKLGTIRKVFQFHKMIA